MKLIKLEKYRCAYCDQLSAYLDASLNPHSTYESINIEDSPETAAKYGIMSAPVLILEDDQGNEIGRMVGYSPGRAEEVEQLLEIFYGGA
jgi:hypothetical protein